MNTPLRSLQRPLKRSLRFHLAGRLRHWPPLASATARLNRRRLTLRCPAAGRRPASCADESR